MLGDMIKFMFFFLLVFVPAEAITKYVICDTPAVELFYILCDDTNQLTINVDPCWFNWKGPLNISATIIPKMNIDYVYAIVEVWQNELKVSDGRHELCTGTDDEFDFCSAVKGETITVHKARTLSKLPFMQGTLTGKVRVFGGQKEELIICADVTLIIK